MQGMHIFNVCKDFGIAQLLPPAQDGVSMVFPDGQLVLPADGFLLSAICHRHIEGSHVVATSSQPRQVPVHLVGDDDMRAAQRKSFGQAPLHRCRGSFIHQTVLDAFLGTIQDKTLTVRPLPGAAAGPEMHRHLVHLAFLKLKHRRPPYSSISNRAELRALPCLSMAKLRNTPPPKARSITKFSAQIPSTS